jgi:uncharacterized protein YndB with AHSA1/START domain
MHTLDTPTDTTIVMSRVFDAPRELVFAAHTRAEHLKRWWGRGNPLDVEIDLRPGGAWRCVETAPDGTRHAFRGEYLEITPPERLVQTFEYEGMPGHVLTETHVFTEEDGRTRLTSTAAFDSAADRDGMLQSGMESGAAQSYAALDKLLAELV